MRFAIGIIIIVFLIVFLVHRYYGIQNLFDFKFDIVGIDVDLGNLISDENKTATITFQVDLKNRSTETIIFKNLVVELYTPDGFKIGETPLDYKNLKTTVLEAGKEFTYQGTINVLLNGTTINLMTAVFNGKEISIKYVLKVGVTSFGIPIRLSDNIKYKK